MLQITPPAEEISDNKLEIGDLVIDRAVYLVFQEWRKVVVLAKKEFELLFAGLKTRQSIYP